MSGPKRRQQLLLGRLASGTEYYFFLKPLSASAKARKPGTTKKTQVSPESSAVVRLKRKPAGEKKTKTD